MTDEERYNTAVARVRAQFDVEKSHELPVFQELDRKLILSAIEVETSVERLPASAKLDFTMELIVGRKSRRGAPTSIKFVNVTREISRTAYVVALLGLFEAAAMTAPDPIKLISALVGLTYAAFTATRATINYSDAAVLHKAWRIAGDRATRAFTLDEILAVRDSIASEYSAPKCKSESEIADALLNLCGLRAISQAGGEYVLKEHITFFEDGRIMN